jgi:hypothetical protein
MPGFSDQNLIWLRRSKIEDEDEDEFEDDCGRSVPLLLGNPVKASLKKTDNLSLSPGNVPLTESEPPAECSVQLCRE